MSTDRIDGVTLIHPELGETTACEGDLERINQLRALPEGELRKLADEQRDYLARVLVYGRVVSPMGIFS
jgi:hypothetical protein